MSTVLEGQPRSIEVRSETSLVEVKPETRSVELKPETSLVEVTVENQGMKAEEEEEVPAFLTRRSARATAILLVAGVAQLWFWNAILNLSEVINAEYFPAYVNSLNSYMTFVYELGGLMAFFGSRFLDTLSCHVLFGTACAGIPLAILMPLILLVSSQTTRVALWYLISAGFGAWVAMSQVSHIALAANMPSGSRSPVVSAGQGLSGLLSYLLYLVMIRLRGASGLTAISTQMGLQLVLIAVGHFSMYTLRRHPIIQRHVVKQREIHAAAVAEHGKPSLLQLAIKGWFPLTNIALTFLCSYVVYPNVGPFKWPADGGDAQREVVIGCAQLGSILGACAPLIPFFIFKIRTVFVINVLRCVYPVLFSLAAVYTGVSAFSAYWFQCIVLFTLALSEGWMASLGLFHAANTGENILEKAELSMLAVATLEIGSTLALGLTTPLQKALHI